LSDVINHEKVILEKYEKVKKVKRWNHEKWKGDVPQGDFGKVVLQYEDNCTWNQTRTIKYMLS